MTHINIADLQGGFTGAAHNPAAQKAFASAVEAALVIHAVRERLRDLDLPSLKADSAAKPGSGALNVALVQDDKSAGRSA